MQKECKQTTATLNALFFCLDLPTEKAQVDK
jgi:hypothetical protein